MVDLLMDAAGGEAMAKAMLARGAVARQPDPIDVEVGLNLRRARLARGYSQASLAEQLGLTFQQIQHYERGGNRVSASMLVRAARALEIPAADLLPAEDGQGLEPSVTRRMSEVRGMAALANAYCALRSPALRRAVLQVVRVMAKEQKAPAGLAEGETR
jgi:transcriptional regulator with XRE-family HTH domain